MITHINNIGQLTVAIQASRFDAVAKHTGLVGKFLHFFGQTEKVWDEKSKNFFYIDKKQLAKSLVNGNLSSAQQTKISNKFIEIANPYTDKQLTMDVYKDAYMGFKIPAESFEKGMVQLEAQKQANSEFTQVYYNENLSEITNMLKPGDILVKKYHEDNHNVICDLQGFFANLFGKKGYREAYKCSHTAMYLGKINGEHWVAEAVLPNGNDPQVRRLRIDDPRFNLADKNQYMIVRNKNEEVAVESVRQARQSALKMNLDAEVKSTEDDKNSAFSYNHLEALRSLWHSSHFGFFAKQRAFKYYSDLKNGVPFQYITDRRNFFCSEFVLLSIQMAELKKNERFQQIMEVNPAPKSDENEKSGVAKFFAKISYVVRRALWSLKMSYKYSAEMDNIVNTRVDLVRTSPQDTLNHFLNNPSYEVVGVINKEKDRYAKQITLQRNEDE